MTADLATLRALLDRVSAAKGGDRELERAIGEAFPPPGGWYDEDWIPRYTDSLDDLFDFAASILPRWSVNMGLSEGYQHPCVVMGRSYPTNMRVAIEHHTLPLAVLSALLKAKISEAEAPKTSLNSGSGANA